VDQKIASTAKDKLVGLIWWKADTRMRKLRGEKKRRATKKKRVT
jgi:hypothetical protein